MRQRGLGDSLIHGLSNLQFKLFDVGRDLRDLITLVLDGADGAGNCLLKPIQDRLERKLVPDTHEERVNK